MEGVIGFLYVAFYHKGSLELHFTSDCSNEGGGMEEVLERGEKGFFLACDRGSWKKPGRKKEKPLLFQGSSGL